MKMMEKFSEMERKIQSLEATVSEQSDLISKQSDLISVQSDTITELKTLVNFYEEQFKLSQRRQFGTSSEQSSDQIRIDNMFNEAEDAANPALPEPTFEEISYKRKKRVGKKEEDLEGLETERIDYELSESERECPECKNVRRKIGETVRDELEIIPAKVIRKQHIVHAYGCDKCDKKGNGAHIIRAEAPAPLISGSLASPSVVAHIATQKFVNGIPLYRQEKGFGYDGVVLSRQNMANWMVYTAQNYMQAIYSLMIESLLSEDIGHADETTVQVLQEPGRAAQSKSYEWLYRSGANSKKPVVIYEYTETRKQEHPQRFLKDFKGFLHTDGYQVYHNLPSDIVVVGCWSHCRRYWEKAYEALDKNKRDGSNAERGLVYCNLMFALEYDFHDLSPDERYEKRLEESKPVSDDFFNWIGTLNALPKSLMGEAIKYSLSQRKYLENVYLDGRLELSNNLAERALKPFVQGRKQWLFSCTPNGAESSSIYYSIVETAKANNLNPFQYIKFLLDKLPSMKISDLATLLPWSESLPDECRIPEKISNNKPERPKYLKGKGPLHNALQKLREKFRSSDSSPIKQLA